MRGYLRSFPTRICKTLQDGTNLSQRYKIHKDTHGRVLSIFCMIQERKHIFVFFWIAFLHVKPSVPACNPPCRHARDGSSWSARWDGGGPWPKNHRNVQVISHNFCDAHQIHQALSPLLFQGLLKNRLVKCFGVGNRFAYPRVIPLSERRHLGSPNHQSTVQNQWPVMIRIILEWYTGCMKFMIGQTCSISTLLKHCFLYGIAMPESACTLQVISL